VIAAPMNDHACLGPTTELILAEVEAGNPTLVELASRFSDTDTLAAWFRTLPQRDDDGVPGEGPKVEACRPPQRLQFDNPTPNCFERSAVWTGTAELIDPEPVYRLSTIETPNGLHTFPTRDGVPVILDPHGTRNTPRGTVPEVDVETRRLRLRRRIGLDETKGLRGDLARARKAKELGQPTGIDGKPIDQEIAEYEKALAYYQAQLAALAPRDARNAGGTAPIMLTPTEAIDWIAELAKVPAERLPGGSRRVERGHRAMRGVFVLQPICIADARDVALVLALAEREARAYGLAGLKIVHSTTHALDALDQLAAERVTAPIRNSPLSALGALFDPRALAPWLGALTRVGGRVAGGIGLETLKLKLAAVGVSAPVIAAFERELNREGLSLGPLAKPVPMLGSLDSMTPQALGARWLARKL
jgi:hypothetical protein